MKEAQSLLGNQVARGLVGVDLPVSRVGVILAPADFQVSTGLSLNGDRAVLDGANVNLSARPSGLLVVGNGKESEAKRQPTHRLVMITDFSSAMGAKKDDRSPNEVVIAYNKVLEQNGVETHEPLIRDNGAYALRPISGAYLNDLYARRFEDNDTNRVHVVVCDPGVGGDREGIVVRTTKATYVGPNNGVFWETIKREGLATNADGEPEVYKVLDEKFQEVKSATFHGREVFAPVAAEIASGRNPSQITEWLEPFDAKGLVKLDFEDNQVLEVDGFNLVKINGTIPEGNPTYAEVTTTDRSTGEQRTLTIPTAEKFVDKQIGDLMIYPGSDDGRLEIAASMAVHGHEDNAVKQLSVNKNNPIEPGDILNITWGYGPIQKALEEGVQVTI
jgi:S-adenosylmethionine hydrolase